MTIHSRAGARHSISTPTTRDAHAIVTSSNALRALAVGAIAIGAIAIGRLRILEARIETLSIGTLTVDNLKVRSR